MISIFLRVISAEHMIFFLNIWIFSSLENVQQNMS